MPYVIFVRFSYVFPWFMCGFGANSKWIPCEFTIPGKIRVIRGIPGEFTGFRVNSAWIRSEFRVFSVKFLWFSRTFVSFVRFSTEFRSNSVSFLCFPRFSWIPCELRANSVISVWIRCDLRVISVIFEMFVRFPTVFRGIFMVFRDFCDFCDFHASSGWISV
jgi:hypothetical protein